MGIVISDDVKQMKNEERIVFVRDNNIGEDPEIDKKIMEILYLFSYVLIRKHKTFSLIDNKELRNELIVDCAVDMMLITFKRMSSGNTKIINAFSYMNFLYEELISNYLRVFYYKLPKELKTTVDNGVKKVLTVGDWYHYTDRKFNLVEVDLSYSSLYKIVKDLIKKIPCKNDMDIKNLYISVMLTILNIIRIPRDDAYRIREAYGDCRERNYSFVARKIMYKCRTKVKYEPAVLYHLDDKMNGLVNILARRAIRKLLRDISYYNRLCGSDYDDMVVSQYRHIDVYGDDREDY